MQKNKIKQIAVETIKEEYNAIASLVHYIDDSFVSAVELVDQMKGRLVVTGIGKSAVIGQKIVATLNSTGTPAIFMHPADAIHGDLGIILDDDVVLCISKSGSTPEIKVLIPIIKSRGNKIIAMVSNTQSYLAQNVDFVLKAHVEKEACPNNLAPTSSTTAQLVLGDAFAVCLLEMKGFSMEDFAKVHPGGILGKKLYLRVADLFVQNPVPAVSPSETIRNTILEISAKRLGATAVVSADKDLLGVITDGDLRRMMEKYHSVDNLKAEDIMTLDPKQVKPDELAVRAYSLMEKNNITQLPVCADGKYLGMIHLHDILKEGII